MKKNLLLTAVMLVTLTGCDYFPFGYTGIGEVVKNPARFQGKEIKVKGTVSDAVKIPFVEMKLYTIKGEGGELTVLTDGPLPAADQQIAIRATVDSMAVIDGEIIGLKLKETKRL